MGEATKSVQEASKSALEASKTAAGVSKNTFDDLTYVSKSTFGDLTKSAKEVAAKKGLLKVRHIINDTFLHFFKFGNLLDWFIHWINQDLSFKKFLKKLWRHLKEIPNKSYNNSANIWNKL